MPSPVADKPGLLLRDPFRYTEDILIVPPFWVALLRCLDGQHSTLEAQTLMTRLAAGEIVTRREVEEFVSILSEAGFLENDALAGRKERCHEEFRVKNVRDATHAGSAYPADPEEIELQFSERLARKTGHDDVWPRGLAAPHVSPEGGFPSYRAAYALPDAKEDLTFVILGTSHYGAPERFGVTAKPFRTPLGEVGVDRGALSCFIDRAGDSIVEEDYCQKTEHSIEFQVLFLQYRLGRPFRIVPILCGPFVESLMTGKPPESIDGNRRAFDALSELAAARPDLIWVLGVDMAHIGSRYGEGEPVRANEGRMHEVREQDERRLERVCEGDAEGFFDLVHPDGDVLNWCGYAPIYTFLKSVGSVVELRGDVLSYEQWNIDPQSVVSFAAIHFFPRSSSMTRDR